MRTRTRSRVATIVLTAASAGASLGAVLGATSARANDAPEVEEASFYVEEDKELTGAIKARDQNGDALSFRITKKPRNGEAALTSDGKLTYTPKANWHGTEEIGFEVTDGKAKTARKAVITVSSVNDPPVAQPLGEVKGVEDKPVKGELDVKDADGDPVTFSVREAPARGTLDIEARTGRFTLTPAENQAGVIKAVVRLNDGTTEVDVPLAFAIAPVNDPPDVRAQTVATKEDEPLRGKLDAEDVDGDALRFALTDKPAHGTVTIDDKGAFAYTPAKEYAGEDGFGYTASDGKNTVKGRVTIDVKNVNDPPTIFPLALETNEDQPVKGKVVAKDFDGDDVYYSLKTDPKGGDAEIDHGTGEVTYKPKANFFGSDTFLVEASDVTGGVSAAVTLTVKPVNDAPVSEDDSAKGNEDQPIAGKLRASDIDKDALTFTLAKAPRSGTVEVDPKGTFKYAPNANFNGDDAFVFEVTDGKAKAQSTITLDVRPVNDAPTLAAAKATTSEDAPAKGRVVGADIDKDALSYALGKRSTKGKVSVDEATGAFVYTPNQDENGDDAFTIKVSDGSAEAEATVSVAIAAVNDAPVAQAAEKAGDEDHPIQGDAIATDVDRDTLTFRAITKPRWGALALDEKSGEWTYTPKAHFNGGDGFRFEVTDGKLRASADVKLVVNAVNDAPDTRPLAIKATEDKPATGAVVASDIDKDKLSYAESRAPQKGKVAVDAATGRVTYTPNLNENGEDTFVVSVSDGTTKTDANVTVSIAPVNDAPVATGHETRGDEDAPIQGKLVASDVDKDTLAWTAVSKPRLGSVAVDKATGMYTYTPAPHANGLDTFRFEVTDGKLKASADIKLVVVPVNDAPQPKELALGTAEDKATGGKLAATDIDKDVLTYRVKKPPGRGTAIVDDVTGAVRYVPARDLHGKETFVVEVSDGFATADANVTVEVAPVPDAPLVDPRPIETAEDEPVSVKLAALDADGDDVRFKVVTQPRLAAAVIEEDGKTLKITPLPDQHGEGEVVVEATDGRHKVRAAIPVLVAARNDAPTIDELKAETVEEAPVVVAVVAHDRDGDPVKLALDPKAPKEATLEGGVVRVVPRRDFAGALDIGVIASDAAGAKGVARLVVTVVNVNDPPTIKDVALKASPERIVNGAMEASDVDAGDELTFSLAVPPRQGSATVDDPRTGRFTYTADASARGEDSFRVRVKDKSGASATATVKVTITNAPAPPPKVIPDAKPAPKPTGKPVAKS